MTSIRKRSVPNRWDEQRKRSAARSAAYWQEQREAAGDCVDQVAVAWDRLRCALRALDRKAHNRVARARTDQDRAAAGRGQQQAARLIAETCARAAAALDRLADDVRGQS